MKLRPAVESDLPGILTIHNHAIRTSTAVYDEEPHTLAMRRDWFLAKENTGMPVLVIEEADGIAGFGTYGSFRSWSGNHRSVEHSLYIAEEKRRRGYGRLLLTTLIEIATKQGMHTMIAGIDAQNEISIRLHLDFGFLQIAHLREVGYKFNCWHDLIYLQRFLDTATPC